MILWVFLVSKDKKVGKIWFRKLSVVLKKTGYLMRYRMYNVNKLFCYIFREGTFKQMSILN